MVPPTKARVQLIEMRVLLIFKSFLPPTIYTEINKCKLFIKPSESERRGARKTKRERERE